MNAERSRLVNEIFAHALEREPHERKAFIERACEHDPLVKKEVESLIGSHEKTSSFSRPAGFVGIAVGPYEIQAQIGSGGMGEVYRAHDTRLGRDVAIKIAVEHFSERFEREARAVAALNHPNTCHLYDVGPNYLVMELVEGPTLSDRLKEGPIPLDEALKIAAQIAEALEAAHEKGITHRDLKPGTIKIRTNGMVKVLDFGLAKRGGIPGRQADDSPTVTNAQTEAGVILGTAAYMSPEQAKGKPVDQRADIYAFGAVFYEMVTGMRLHDGETATEKLASVMKEEPRWEKVPAPVQRLLRRCLEDRKAFSFLTSEFTEGLSRFSPDGRWVAYQSNESGTNEIYVRPFMPNADGTFAATGGKWMVSKGGGSFQGWRRDGKQLFYIWQNGLSAVVVATEKKTFEYGIPKRLFRVPVPPNANLGGGDISGDGKQFWFAAPLAATGPPQPFTVVLNWQIALKK